MIKDQRTLENVEVPSKKRLFEVKYWQEWSREASKEERVVVC